MRNANILNSKFYSLIVFIIFFNFHIGGFAQNRPDCTHMYVKNISLKGDTISITINNTCTTCNSGYDGCVYMYMFLIRTVSPFDTLAKSDCSCLVSPDNNSENTYKYKTKISSLPSFQDLDLIFGCEGKCDNIPFSITAGMAQNEFEERLAQKRNIKRRQIVDEL